MKYHWQRCLSSKTVLNSLIVFVIVVIGGNCGNSAIAQITPDDSLGTESSLITPDVEVKGETADRIDGGAIRESNLFHSFQEFNVREGQSVYFASPESIENIFTRVTGNNPSNILGTLGVDGAANLLLLNPNGILFGENSSLDIEGSFLGTTAESLIFRDGEEFSAVEPRSSLLTISVPLGLQFGSNPGNIMVQSPLEVQPDQNLILLGGDINLEGTNIEVINGLNEPVDGITAPGGKVELGGLETVGKVGINNDGSLNFPEEVTKADVTLNNYEVDVRADGGGSIVINAGNLELFNSQVVAGTDFSVDFPQAQAGDIVINTSEKILLANSTDSISEIVNITGDFSAFINPENNIETINIRGNAGDIIINTGILEMIGASGIGTIGIASLTNGEGNAGNVKISAKERISLTQEEESDAGIGSIVGDLGTGNGANVIITTPSLFVSNSFISAGTAGQGNAGTLSIQTDNLIITEGGQILANTVGAGNGGKIDIQGDSIEILGIRSNSPSGIFANTLDKGNGGNIEIISKSLIVRDGGQIDTEALGTIGKAGDLKIIASDFVELSGTSIDSEGNIIPTRLSSSTSAENAPAGNISIETEQLIITQGAQIQAATSGQGNGGNIDIQSGSINISPSAANLPTGIFTNTFGAGKGGNIGINADSLIVRDGGQIVTEAQGTTGQAGDLKIVADKLVELSGAFRNSGGNIFTTRLSSSTLAENAPAGNISIETEQLIITQGAQIQATTTGNKNGGDIDIQANSIEILGTSPTFPNGIIVQEGSIEILERLTNFSSGIFANTFGAGNGGNIDLTSDLLVVRDGGQIGTEAQGTTGQAGDLKIVADKLVDLSGTFTDSEGNLIRTILSSSTSALDATAGNVTIETEQLTIRDGAQIRAITSAAGDGGDISIKAGSISLLGATVNSPSAILAVSGVTSTENNEIIAGSGDGGTITITTDNLNIQSGAGVGTSSIGTGKAGNISVLVNDSLKANEGQITSSSLLSSGGDINITAGNISLKGNSNIFTNVREGAGSGGNITLTADSVVAFDDSDIFAFSRDGVGGDITININSPVFFLNNFSAANFKANPQSLEGNNQVDINATGLVSGSIDIPDVNFLSDSLVELSEKAIDTEELVANSCVVRDRSSSGTFIITGKGGLPIRPGNWAVSSYSTGDVRAIPNKTNTTSTNNNWRSGDPIVEPQAIYRLSNGQLVLSRECNTAQ